jgi:ketosteroid isomerase-like protein
MLRHELRRTLPAIEEVSEMTTSTTSRNLATVSAVYEAFARGDGEAFLSQIADECAWDFTFAPDAPIPWLQGGTGKAQAAQFLGRLVENLELNDFQIRHMATNDEENLVVVIFDIACTVKSTGKGIYEQYEPHLWYFNDDGKVIRFRHAADTLQQYQALQP